MEKKYNYFYRITNKVNGNFYYGIHSTNNLNDGYMGSGHRLLKAIKLYGPENFDKEILKFFNKRSELSEYEARFVTEELVENKECYNSIVGGEEFNTIGYTSCFDVEQEKMVFIKTNVYHSNPDRYKNVASGTVMVKRVGTNDWTRVSLDSFKHEKEMYITPMSGKAVVKDKTGKVFVVNKDDPNLKNGKYTYINTGKKHSKNTIEKIKQNHIERGLQKGEKNSNFGKKWMHITDEEGNIISKPFPKNIVSEKEKEGWVLGRIITKKITRPNSIINNIDVDAIIFDYKSGMKLKKLSEKYGISTSYVSKIGRGLRKQTIK